jgi:hypothetical protein
MFFRLGPGNESLVIAADLSGRIPGLICNVLVVVPDGEQVRDE